MLTSYIADLPENDDLLEFKRGSKIMTLCHIWEAQKYEFPIYTVRSQRNLLKTRPVYVTFFLFEEMIYYKRWAGC